MSRNETRGVYGAEDVPYVRAFFPELAPAWLDYVAVTCGVAPPERGAGFGYCDAGCGQGVTAALLAATHPRGRFFGVDRMPAHVAHGRRLASDVGARNARFVAADFARAARTLPPLDYVVAHGVYGWVGVEARRDLLRLVGERLAPGGLAYVSYNALPGRAADVPVQRLVAELADAAGGGTRHRMKAVTGIFRALAAAGAPGVLASDMARLFDARSRTDPAYLAHELMVASWACFFAADVHRAMADVGLEYVGSATLLENHDELVLGAPARRLLARIRGPAARELAREFFLQQSFRRDVFVRGGRRLGAAERRRRLLAATFALVRPPARSIYRGTTPAGRLSCDNPAARALVRTLAREGPRSLAQVAAQHAFAADDLVDNAAALCGLGVLRPVEPDPVDVTAVNETIARRRRGREPIDVVVLPWGTALYGAGRSARA